MIKHDVVISDRFIRRYTLEIIIEMIIDGFEVEHMKNCKGCAATKTVG